MSPGLTPTTDFDVLATLPVPVVMVEIVAEDGLGRAWGNPAACGITEDETPIGNGWSDLAVTPLELAGLPISRSCATSVRDGFCSVDAVVRSRQGMRRVRFTFSTYRTGLDERIFVIGIGADCGGVADGAHDDGGSPESAEILAEIENLALIGHYVVRPDTGAVEWSPGLERVRGFSCGQRPADPAELSETIYPDDAVAVTALETDEAWRRSSIEFRVVRPDGSLRNVYRCSYRQTAPDGRIARVFGIEQDVTDFRIAEKELAAAKVAAEAASKSKTEFLALMSHELRTPLNAIMGFSEVMSQELFGPLSERYLDYSKQVHKSANDLLAIVNDILDLSRIEDGHYELGKEHVDLGKIVREVAEMMREKAERRGIRLDIAPAGPKHFWAEGRAIKTIVCNLVDNAVKFTRGGGEVSVETAPGEGGGAIIRVRDTGIGIRDGDVRRVCEPFFQSRAGMEEAGETGTGLGLAIVKSLVDLHEGRIEIESEVGSGTTFSVIMPGRCYAPGSAPLLGARR